MNPYANEFEVGTAAYRVDRVRPDTSGRPYDRAQSCHWHLLTETTGCAIRYAETLT